MDKDAISFWFRGGDGGRAIPFMYPEYLAPIIEGMASVWTDELGYRLSKVQAGEWIKHASMVYEQVGPTTKDEIVSACRQHVGMGLTLANPSSILYILRDVAAGKNKPAQKSADQFSEDPF